jgi:hypothetical protein
MKIIGNELLDDEIECQNQFTVIPINNKGAGFFLAQNVLVLSFTFMVLMVYFLIPDRYRLIVRFQQKKIPSVSTKSFSAVRNTERDMDVDKSDDLISVDNPGAGVERLLINQIEEEALM